MNVNPYTQVRENLQRSEPLVSRHGEADRLHAILSEIEEKIEEKVLHILVYGAYNAGKSTLINVLLDEDQARVGDIPTTDRADFYDWNGYRLVDTPGINAPIKHEQATADQLARTNAVVLVVREGDQDAKDVYMRLFEMMEQEKEIFIILNHQLGNDVEIVQSIDRIGEILSHLAVEEAINRTQVERLPIYPMNLRTALSGRKRQHEQLLAHSGFTRFADAFADWTRQRDTRHHHLSEIKNTVKSLWYDPVIANLKELEEPQGNGAVDHLRDKERRVTAQKTRMHGAAYSMVQSEIGGIRSSLGEVLESSESTQAADEALSRLLQPVFKKIEAWLHEELGKVQASIEVTADASKIGKGDGSTADKPGSNVKDLIVENRGKVIENVGKFVTDKESVKGVLLAGRGMKAFGIRDVLQLKGKWARTLDKWATGFTRVAKGGLVVLQVGLAVLDAVRADSRQKKENEEMRRMTVEWYRAVDSVCSELRTDLVRVIDEVIEDTLGAELGRIREEIESVTKYRSGRESDYQELLDHRSQLEGIAFTASKQPPAETVVT